MIGLASLNDLSNMVSVSFLADIQRSGESVGESSMPPSSIMCRCSSGEESLSCPSSMTTPVREKKPRSGNRPVRSRSQVQVSGTP